MKPSAWLRIASALALAVALAYMSRGSNESRGIGVFREVERPVYGEAMTAQIEHAVERLGPGSLDKLLHSGDSWTVAGGGSRRSRDLAGRGNRSVSDRRRNGTAPSRRRPPNARAGTSTRPSCPLPMGKQSARVRGISLWATRRGS